MSGGALLAQEEDKINPKARSDGTTTKNAHLGAGFRTKKTQGRGGPRSCCWTCKKLLRFYLLS